MQSGSRSMALNRGLMSSSLITFANSNRYTSGEVLGLSSRRDEFDPHTIRQTIASMAKPADAQG
jgi:hypothetical protein